MILRASTLGKCKNKKDHHRRPSADFAVPTGLASNRRSHLHALTSRRLPQRSNKTSPHVQPQVLPSAPVPPSLRHVLPAIEYHPPLDYRPATFPSGSTDASSQPISRLCCFQSTKRYSTKAKSRSGSDNGHGQRRTLDGCIFSCCNFFTFFRLR